MIDVLRRAAGFDDAGDVAQGHQRIFERWDRNPFVLEFAIDIAQQPQRLARDALGVSLVLPLFVGEETLGLRMIFDAV